MVIANISVICTLIVLSFCKEVFRILIEIGGFEFPLLTYPLLSTLKDSINFRWEIHANLKWPDCYLVNSIPLYYSLYRLLYLGS